MHCRIIEHRCGTGATLRVSRQHRGIVLEQRVDGRRDLAGDASHDLVLADILLLALVVTALDRHQSLLDMRPFTIRLLDGVAHDMALPTMR